MVAHAVNIPRLARSLYAQVLVAVLAGALLGALRPATGVALRPLGDGFIKLVKMLIAPIIFATVVSGIAKMGDLRKLGRIGIKALIYFEAVTTLSLVLGLVVGKLVRPGAGMNVDVASLDAKAVAGFAAAGKHLGIVDFLLGAIPTTLVDAFAKGEILQVLLVSLLIGSAAAAAGAAAAPLGAGVGAPGRGLFPGGGVGMAPPPPGAPGRGAFTVGPDGGGALGRG